MPHCVIVEDREYVRNEGKTGTETKMLLERENICSNKPCTVQYYLLGKNAKMMKSLECISKKLKN